MDASTDHPCIPAHVDDEEAIFAELERDDDHHLAVFREQRMELLKREAYKVQEMKASNHGTYEELPSDKEVLKVTTSTSLCIVHFFHDDFRRCQIMDKHLSILARKHFKTRFVKINVKNAAFLVDRLKVQILPCVICFVDGIATDRLVGFDELGMSDSFPTTILENRLAKSNVITTTESSGQPRKSILGFLDTRSSDDDDDDDDDD
ncbi:hypothetical protein SeMB42_g03055 [Synchytrium endobioticum]|uniref:Phosducin domain-containing protein n=1 Tax=Synchytrium endobioticum TaxID=286115 RepID=A0A507D9V8_9FUNG|nr:hypothetical protein SeMB42_g03055 [Synchytrium endobioticum]TPX50471.1 hypothetical protein SeLEV6574_g00876 [Synchytrium endobioticum]